jgi:hypothetical protein
MAGRQDMRCNELGLVEGFKSPFIASLYEILDILLLIPVALREKKEKKQKRKQEEVRVRV